MVKTKVTAQPSKVDEQEKPARKPIPVVPPPSKDQLHAMLEAGRKAGDEIAERLAPLLVVSEEDLRLRLE